MPNVLSKINHNSRTSSTTSSNINLSLKDDNQPLDLTRLTTAKRSTFSSFFKPSKYVTPLYTEKNQKELRKCQIRNGQVDLLKDKSFSTHLIKNDVMYLYKYKILPIKILLKSDDGRLTELHFTVTRDEQNNIQLYKMNKEGGYEIVEYAGKTSFPYYAYEAEYTTAEVEEAEGQEVVLNKDNNSVLACIQDKINSYTKKNSNQITSVEIKKYQVNNQEIGEQAVNQLQLEAQVQYKVVNELEAQTQYHTDDDKESQLSCSYRPAELSYNYYKATHASLTNQPTPSQTNSLQVLSPSDKYDVDDKYQPSIQTSNIFPHSPITPPSNTKIFYVDDTEYFADDEYDSSTESLLLDNNLNNKPSHSSLSSYATHTSKSPRYAETGIQTDPPNTDAASINELQEKLHKYFARISKMHENVTESFNANASQPSIPILPAISPLTSNTITPPALSTDETKHYLPSEDFSSNRESLLSINEKDLYSLTNASYQTEKSSVKPLSIKSTSKNTDKDAVINYLPLDKELPPLPEKKPTHYDILRNNYYKKNGSAVPKLKPNDTTSQYKKDIKNITRKNDDDNNTYLISNPVRYKYNSTLSAEDFIKYNTVATDAAKHINELERLDFALDAAIRNFKEVNKDTQHLKQQKQANLENIKKLEVHKQYIENLDKQAI